MNCRIKAVLGDITRSHCEAIVNAANEAMLGGGGVDGAIHRAAGRQLLEACRLVPELVPGVRCPTGQARLTPGYNLAARYVIHTVGPIYQRSPAPAEFLEAAHRNCLELAESKGIKTIAFPAISCGVYGYPLQEAADIAIGVARSRDWKLQEITFVLFSEDVLTAYKRAL